MASVASACGIRPGYCECYLPSLDLPTCAVDTWEYRHTPRATETSLTPAGGELRAVPPVLSCGTLFAPLVPVPHEALITQGPAQHLWQSRWFLGRSASSFVLTLQELLIKLIVPSGS